MIGQRLRITAPEKIELHLTHLGCLDDAAEAEVAEDRKRGGPESATAIEKETSGASKKSAAPMIYTADGGTSELWRSRACRLAAGEWLTVQKLCEAAKSLYHFKGLARPSLARAVRNAVYQLRKLGLVEIREERGINKLRSLLIRRPMPPLPPEDDEEVVLDEDLAEPPN